MDVDDGARCELTVLMPCLNEAETLAACIDKAVGFLRREGVAGEVLVADNGSSDGSQGIARARDARVVEVPTKGYGAALLGGVAQARGRFVIMGDADDSYDFSTLDGFLARLRDGADLVIGNRFKGGIAPGAMPPLHRYLGNPVLSLIGRVFFGVPAGDFHCGLRGFRTDRIRALDLRATGMEFASEMVVRAAVAGLRIDEVPCRLVPDGRSRKPHLKTWRDGWRHLKFLLIFSPRWLFLVPGSGLTVLGTVLSAALFFGPIRVDRVVFDLNAFTTACLTVVVGVQLLSFGILSRSFAAMAGLLPNSARVAALVRALTTDRLARGGAGLVLAGLVLFGTALATWASVGFGDLADPTLPWRVMAGLTLVVVGLQMLSTAFFVGILSIPTARYP
ncbi:glycosyltransferase family 2 protein [Lichenibacterium dinghuense]|uniref:glycosyltransferase family 2 protein n=1 Tax=Lichenibacterium dinghuense TaxID=2895977 RepID=UPI001F42729D|nr:glycosyltransferase family 2 protein [Lichenibacterium sp. 6Y81]